MLEDSRVSVTVGLGCVGVLVGPRLLDEVGRPLADHDGGNVGVSRRDCWHH